MNSWAVDLVSTAPFMSCWPPLRAARSEELSVMTMEVRVLSQGLGLRKWLGCLSRTILSEPRNSLSMNGPLPKAIWLRLGYFSSTLAGTMAQVGLAISRTAGTNRLLMTNLKVVSFGVSYASMRWGKRLSGAVMAVPRRLKLSTQSVDGRGSSVAGPLGQATTSGRMV